jgi:Tfp pilus assembly protein PilV
MVVSSWVLVAGAILLIGLGSYAGYLALKLRQKRVAAERAEQQLVEELAAKEADARQSVQIIARALVQKDLTETEAAMRIAWLSQQIKLSEDEAQQVSVFHQLAVATSHIPILDDWAALSKSEKRRLDSERESIESKFSEFIQSSAVELASLELKTAELR